MKAHKSELETLIQFSLEDFESEINNIRVTENKLILLFEQYVKDIIKYNKRKWLFIGIIIGMALIRLLEFILPNT